MYITTPIYFASTFYCLIYDISLDELMLNNRSAKEQMNSWGNNFFQHAS